MILHGENELSVNDPNNFSIKPVYHNNVLFGFNLLYGAELVETFDDLAEVGLNLDCIIYNLLDGMEEYRLLI